MEGSAAPTGALDNRADMAGSAEKVVEWCLSMGVLEADRSRGRVCWPATIVSPTSQPYFMSVIWLSGSVWVG
jgi:hypothetical protein